MKGLASIGAWVGTWVGAWVGAWVGVWVLVWVGALLFVVTPATAAAEPSETAWTLITERNGVVVHVAPGSDGQPIRSRASTQIEATVFEILAVLQDDPRRTEWMSRCVEARQLERRSRWNRLNYTRLAVWPLADRDVVVETRITLGAGAKSAEVHMRSVESELQPVRNRVVRMPSLIGDFHLEANDQGTRVDFTLSMLLGGRVPGSLARYARQTIPLESLEKLRETVRVSRGSYSELIETWQSDLEP